MIAIVAASAVLAAAAIALVVMTRTATAVLKPSADAGARRVMRSLETPLPSTNSPRAGSAGSASALASGDVAGAGSGGDNTAEIAQGLETLAAEVAQHHWENAIAQCANPAVVLAGARACVATACELHMAPKARAWLVHVAPGDRDDVIAECTAAHVQLGRPQRPIFGIHRHPARSPAGSGG